MTTPIPSPSRHVVTFSGGVGSWAAAKRVVAQYGCEDVTLLFTDTRMEDEDLYRFFAEAAANVGPVQVVWLADGRTPWDVFFTKRFLGNSQVDPCSQVLKREPAARWLDENCDPANTIVYVGIDWSEAHRYERLRDRRVAEGWTYRAPLCEPPYLTKSDVFAWLKREGIQRPRLYDLGFEHNNCGGFCIKAGHGHFKRLLDTMPDRYRFHEQREQDIRVYLNADVSILSDRSGDGLKKPLTLQAFRERIEAGDAQIDLFDLGGCGCFIDEPEAA
jgi:3'-phosphoadenosine 5'-phosphosulfate sulfotransferase (PAPS reductase)/FAD synthetase